ncbi:hypothetical protein F383_16539 [Gossypium arboreum]|uniref:Uncharacterized protein n=1 Tax=Gossypium arboreum TaxID=29729 RepID=A0A0B0PYE0_GOSAR|nr:hypothetical protein F383_16539 [Gossypium arboreum]
MKLIRAELKPQKVNGSS